MCVQCGKELHDMAEGKRTPISARIAEMFKKARTRKEWSQSELASKAKVPRARIKRLECRELSSIDSREFVAISRALGLALPKGGLPKHQSSNGSSKKATPGKRRLSSKQKKAASSGRNGKISRKQLVAQLDRAGVLDMTLRELLG